MGYDESQWYGDLLCDEYDEQNNFMNPPSPTGWYVYKIVGYTLDKMQNLSSKFLNDYSILSADASSLDYFWGLSYNMPRPTIGTAPNERLLTDDEYRIYLYLRNCQLITIEDLQINLGKCFNNENNDDTVYFDYIEDGLKSTDHPHYTSRVTDLSNIAKQADDTTGDYTTDYANDSDATNKIRGVLSSTTDLTLRVNVPSPDTGAWDTDFLDLLQEYISIKGNVVIREATR